MFLQKRGSARLPNRWVLQRHEHFLEGQGTVPGCSRKSVEHLQGKASILTVRFNTNALFGPSCIDC